MKFVATDGNTNFSVSEGKLSQLELEVIESKYSINRQNDDRRGENLNDVMTVLTQAGEAGTRGEGSLFTKPKSNIPDPNALLAFIEGANAKDPEINPEVVSDEELFVNNGDADVNQIINNDQYLSDLIGAQLDNSSNEQKKDKVANFQPETNEDIPEINPDSGEANMVEPDDKPEVESEEDFVSQPSHDELVAEILEKDAKIEALQSEIEELKKRAESQAKEHSDKIVKLQADAEKDADEAYEKGMEEGVANSQKEINEIKEQLAKVSQGIPIALNNYLKELDEQMKNEVCSFSLSIAETFIRRELGDRDLLKDTIQSVLSPIINFRGVTLFLNPEIVELAQAGEFGDLPNALTIEGDPQLKVGEALVKSDMGIIDATLERRLNDLRESFDKPLSSEV